MSRNHKNKKKIIIPDGKYNCILISKVINIMMLKGKKSISTNILYQTFNLLKQHFHNDNINPVYLFKKAIQQVEPLVEIRTRRIGGATYQVPIAIPLERRSILAIRWIIIAARKRIKHEPKPMFIRLANEIIDILAHKGHALKKREEIHKMAEANKAFAHYRW